MKYDDTIKLPNQVKSDIVVSYLVVANNIKAYEMPNGRVKVVRLISKNKCSVQYFNNMLDVYQVYGVYHYNTDRKV